MCIGATKEGESLLLPQFKVQINAEGECIHSSNSPHMSPMNIDGDSEDMEYLIHTGCQGFIDKYSTVSRFFDVLVCRKCNLRVHVLKNLNTWHKLISYLKATLTLTTLYCSKCNRIQHVVAQYAGQICEVSSYCGDGTCDGILFALKNESRREEN